MVANLAHAEFDIVSSVTAFCLTWIAYRTRFSTIERLNPDRLGPGYAAALLAGAAIGGFGLGSANLFLSDIHEIGRSILGALAGAILAIEIYKRACGITGSTGVMFVPAFVTTIVIGRLGCHFAGLEDQTYGVPTTLPWGVDLGDGVQRHPVAIYESLCMAAFGLFAARRIVMRDTWFFANGFYAMVATYAGQRFVWEFFKPYATLIGPLNIFHFVCATLLIYAGTMISRAAHVRT